MVYRVDAEPGVPIKVAKVGFVPHLAWRPVRELVDRCRRTLDRTAEQGVEQQFADQRAWLDAYWERSDVEVAGQPAVQQAVRWNLFQLAQATSRAEQSGVPAKGVTGSGYGGHYFWDTEVYVLPFLIYTSPKMARSALRFRYNMLDAARRRAQDLAQSGALFPWRTINGEEASAYYAAGTAQYHIDADISYALCKYVERHRRRRLHVARGGRHPGRDRPAVGRPRFLARAERRPTATVRTFHIHGVTGPDEYTTVVNDNLFTNVMARFNLAKAAEVVQQPGDADDGRYDSLVQRLGLESHEVDEWAAAAQAMFIPFDPTTGINPQDSPFLDREVWDLKNTPADKRPLLLHYHPLVIYRFQVLKQADVVLALFLQGDHFRLADKRADFEYYDPITTGDSTLSGVVQSIIAAEVGYRELALRYFHSSLVRGPGRPARQHHRRGARGLHRWRVERTGVRLRRDARLQRQDHLRPAATRQLAGLIFRITLRGHPSAGDPDRRRHQLRVEDGDRASLTVRDHHFTVSADTPVTVPLVGHGPRIEGDAGAAGRRPTGRRHPDHRHRPAVRAPAPSALAHATRRPAPRARYPCPASSRSQLVAYRRRAIASGSSSRSRTWRALRRVTALVQARPGRCPGPRGRVRRSCGCRWPG